MLVAALGDGQERRSPAAGLTECASWDEGTGQVRLLVLLGGGPAPFTDCRPALAPAEGSRAFDVRR